MLKIQEEIVFLLERRPLENFSLLWEMLFSIRTCLEPPCMPCLPLDNYGRERTVLTNTYELIESFKRDH